MFHLSRYQFQISRKVNKISLNIDFFFQGQISNMHCLNDSFNGALKIYSSFEEPKGFSYLVSNYNGL